MKHLRAVVFFPTALLLLSAACEPAKTPPPHNDTVAKAPSPPETATVVPVEERTWDSTTGPAMFVSTGAPQEAVIVVPAFTQSAALDTARFDLSGLRDLRLDLFARSRSAGEARVVATTVGTAGNNCTAWPTARLAPAAGAALSPWTVAFTDEHAQLIPLDSIESLSRPDSAKLVADIERLASALPGDTAPAFRGLPFVVREVRRFRPAPGVEALIAEVHRRVNQEANPLQESLFIVAERDSGQAAARYEPVYTERVSGAEETLEAIDVLAAAKLGADRRPTLILARDYGNGTAFSLVPRVGHRRWRETWSSAYAGC